jgi:hypothetical protein
MNGLDWLAKPPGHGRAAAQEITDLLSGEPRENGIPFEQNGPNICAVASDPTSKIVASPLQEAWIASKSCGQFSIVLGIPEINGLV